LNIVLDFNINPEAGTSVVARGVESSAVLMLFVMLIND